MFCPICLLFTNPVFCFPPHSALALDGFFSVLRLDIATGETPQVITSLHFFVDIYSNIFGSYQFKGKYNTHIQQLNISLHFSSLHTLTSIIN